MKQRIVHAAARPEFWLLALLVWLLLSAGRSLGTPWERAALTEALRWSAGIGLALTLGVFLRQTQAAPRAVVLLASGLALLGIGAGFQPAQGGLTGPYREHQLYGSVLLILLPPVLAVALTARDHRWRLGAGAAASLGALCLFLSQTRSAWIGAAASALVFGGLWLRRAPRRDRRSVCLSAAVLAGAVLAVWLLTAPANLSAPLTHRFGTLSALGADPSWQERLSLWRGASRLAAAHPLCGIGLGRYPGAQWAWTRAGTPLEPMDRPTLSEEAHDFYLQTAAETGLLGLSLYGAALAAFVVQGLRRLRQTHPSRSASREALIIASLSLVAGQAVDAVASPSWQFAEASFFFWALLGVGLAAFRREAPEAIPAPVAPALSRMPRLALAGGVAVIAAASLLPVGLLSPVEAYTAQTGWTYVAGSLTISGPTTLTAGQTATYTLTATYVDTHQQNHLVDVSFDPVPPMTGSAATFGITPFPGRFSNGASFGTAGTSRRNVLTTLAGVSSGDKFYVGGTFYDNGFSAKFAPSLTVTVQ